ncbi:MAG TPA: hypothetical protein PKW55_00625 [Spirochaetota bacterium]|nr:hypothetical protein [Spirochaetota bacterium]HOM39261.1 hypothetical protein [Spirochaetota bacterium]HPQ49262.1 hypothetical protein [Spirochaetota bacterium]
MNRKDAVNYITWGLLLFIIGIIILFVKVLTTFFLFYWILGVILILLGLTYIKKKTFLGFVLILLGIFTLLGKLSNSLGKLLSLVGWIGLIGGIVFIGIGLLQVKKNS